MLKALRRREHEASVYESLNTNPHTLTAGGSMHKMLEKKGDFGSRGSF